jgi:hypothetical protein
MDTVEKFGHLAPTRDSNRTEILRQAAERRNPRARVAASGKTPRISKNSDFEPWDADHHVRQEFRRMLDPGILRYNDKKDAVASLKVRSLADAPQSFNSKPIPGRQVLSEITENILKNPDDPKYRRLKITAKKMNQQIMPMNGTVEFLQKVCSSRGVFVN